MQEKYSKLIKGEKIVNAGFQFRSQKTLANTERRYKG